MKMKIKIKNNIKKNIIEKKNNSKCKIKNKLKINIKINKNDNSLNLKKIKKNVKIKTKTKRKENDSFNLLDKFIKFKKKEKNKSYLKINFLQQKNSVGSNYKPNNLNSLEKCFKNFKKINIINNEKRNLNKFNRFNCISFKDNKINRTFNIDTKKSIKKLPLKRKRKIKNFYNKNIFELNKPNYFFNLKNKNFKEFVDNVLQHIETIENKDTFINFIKKEKIEKINFKLDNEKINLVIDLDETLIHSFEEDEYHKDLEYDFNVNFYDLNSTKKDTVYILKRPFLKDFLKFVNKYYNIIIYTAGTKEYADKVLNFWDPKNKYFNNRLYRKNCIMFNEENNICIKDLTVIEGINLDKTLIIDNLVFSFVSNLRNGIVIFPFIDNKKDKELLKLIKYLKFLRLYNNQVHQNYKYFGYNNWNKEMINNIKNN